MRMMKCSLVVSCLCSLAAASNAAHWELISLADSNYPAPPLISDSFTTRILNIRQFNAAIPQHASMIYGDGTFTFYGEQAQMWPTYSGGPITFADQNYVNSYYEFKFKWVSDSPSDVPPPVTTSIDAFGYALERAENEFKLHAIFGGPWSIGINSISMCFPVYGPVWSVPGGTTFGLNYPYTWPTSGGLDIKITVPNIGLMYVRPQSVGGGGISIDSNGDTIATISVLNSMVQTFSIPVTTPGGGITVGLYVKGFFSCYKSVTQMVGLPVIY